ncbi:hypothetical protein ACFX11_025560 [Malus domestica]
MDKDWLTFSRPSTEYREGAQNFVQVAKEYGGNRDKIICPCIICQNQCFQLPAIVYEHLVVNGIDHSYTTWVFHGEQEVDDASRQASKASSQRSSPNIERYNIKRKEGSKAISQLQLVGILRGSSCKLLNWLGNGQVVATGEIESTNPDAKVHRMVLGPDCWKVWVTVVRVENISLYCLTSEFRVLDDAIASTIAWPSKYVRVGE